MKIKAKGISQKRVSVTTNDPNETPKAKNQKSIQHNERATNHSKLGAEMLEASTDNYGKPKRR